RAPMPPRPGILRSMVTTSVVPSPTMVRASLPLLAVSTSQSLCRIARSDSRTPRSSSTINSRGRSFMLGGHLCTLHASVGGGKGRAGAAFSPAAAASCSGMNDAWAAHGTGRRHLTLGSNDAELVHAGLEDPARRAEQLGGPGLVEVGLLQRLVDGLGLGL